MLNFGGKVVKHRKLILAVCLLLLIPSVLGVIKTRINYDVLTYLPEDIETIKGQNILLEDFGKGAFSMVMTEGLSTSEKVELEDKMEAVDHVASVISYETALDASVPAEILPEEFQDAIQKGDTSLMAVFFDTSTSADETMDAIKEIRSLAAKQCFVSGMSAVVTDTKDLAEHEEPIYVMIAVILSALVLAVCMDSFFIPVIFLMGIGMEILYNLGSNVFMGEISYVTKALSAVLQLGVTMDYSIFLWHSYQEQRKLYGEDHKEAMAQAIAATIKSVVGSSITTIAGFVALCFMSFTLGLDLGIVMAKGVIFGVICCVTVLPSMIMIFDKALEKTKHKQLIPDFPKISEFLVKHHKAFAFLCVALFLPFAYFQANTAVYYNLDSSLPKNLESIMANEKLQEEYHMGAAHMILMDKNVSSKEKHKMIKEMEQVDGVKEVLGLESIIGPTLPESMIPQDIKDILESDNYELMLITNEYQTASEEVNVQISELNTILKSYDKNGMLVGEAPCTKDLIEITDHDFKVVSAVSIIAVFLIILFVFKSITLPVILVLVIEGAIFINMGIPYLTGTELPFIASIVIGTIQLGATVDYAILMTSRYEQERGSGKSKKESISIALESSIRPVMVSASSFFAATFGVGIYSKIDMISSLCLLMARGALISMCAVLLFLPAMYWIFDRVICATSKNFKVRK